MFYKGTFTAQEKKDCFVHLENFTKGFVTVNGFNLGRYWEIGPQLSLYLPASVLKEENEIVVFDVHPSDNPVVGGTTLGEDIEIGVKLPSLTPRPRFPSAQVEVF